MPTSTPPPLDYATRTALAGVDTLVVNKALTAADGARLRTTITAAYYQKHTPPAPAPTVAPVRKAAAAAPPPSATDRLHEAVATRQAAQPGLRFVAALDAVNKATPALYAEYQRDARYPHLRGQAMPVEKAAPLTYAAILAMADTRVTKATGLSRRDALIALVEEHPGEQAYYEAYRKYHVTDGLAEHHAAVMAQGRAD